jgi:positive regulator of sigma E activity
MLVIETIHLDYLGDLESTIFLVGFILVSIYILLFRFSRKEEQQEKQHYYSRHNVPFEDKK